MHRCRFCSIDVVEWGTLANQRLGPFRVLLPPNSPQEFPVPSRNARQENFYGVLLPPLLVVSEGTQLNASRVRYLLIGEATRFDPSPNKASCVAELR
jgi:hypothetical protein